MHRINYAGACETCGRSVYSTGCIGEGSRNCGDTHDGSEDPRGIIPENHARHLQHAFENDCTGRDLVQCCACANEGDKYRAIVAAALSSGTWRKALTCQGVKLAPYDQSLWTAYGPQPYNGPTYKNRAGELWHVDKVEAYLVHLWATTAHGGTARKNMTLQEFREKFTEYMEGGAQ